MESIAKIAKISSRVASKLKIDPHLHSPAHVLADELSIRLRDKKHFGFYLKMALTHEHQFLRKLMGQILESKSVKSPGRLFAYLIKQNNRSGSTD